MHVGTISFCDKTGYNMKSDEDKTRILNDIEERFGIRVLKKHHDAFGAESVHTIQKSPYLAGLRTNGNPYYLFLTKMNFVETCIFIDKKIQQGYFLPRMIVTKLWFDAQMFQDTLLEGEMVKRQDGSWLFLVSDLLVDCGTAMTNQNLVKRINRVYTMLAQHWRRDRLDVCDIQVKKYFRVTDVAQQVRSMLPTLDYTCRGVYFKPFFLKFRDILLNFDDNLVKKVTRTKYKEASNFLLLDAVKHMAEKSKENNNNTTTDVTQESEKSEPNDAGDINKCEADLQKHVSPSHYTCNSTCKQSNHIHAVKRVAHAHTVPSLEPVQEDAATCTANQHATFLVKKTALPDVYELYRSSADVGKRIFMEACVPNLRHSKHLRSLFLSMGVTDTLLMTCEFNARFQKWTPLTPVVAP